MRLIEQQKALETIANVDNYGDGVAYEVLGHAYRDVALIPTVDAVPVEWIKKYMSRCLAIEQDAIGEMVKAWAERN